MPGLLERYEQVTPTKENRESVPSRLFDDNVH